MISYNACNTASIESRHYGIIPFAAVYENTGDCCNGTSAIAVLFCQRKVNQREGNSLNIDILCYINTV